VNRYSARLRSLEHRIAPGACLLCAGYPAIDFVTIHGDETPPPPPVCEKCGKPCRQFIVHHAAEPIDTQQPVRTARVDNPRAETAPKPLVRRRQYNGPE